MKSTLSRLFIISIVITSMLPAFAKNIGFIEDFALSQDRQQTLKQLIPGTRDYYYYHCLHYLNQEKFDQVEKQLKYDSHRLPKNIDCNSSKDKWQQWSQHTINDVTQRQQNTCSF